LRSEEVRVTFFFPEQVVVVEVAEKNHVEVLRGFDNPLHILSCMGTMQDIVNGVKGCQVVAVNISIYDQEGAEASLKLNPCDVGRFSWYYNPA
jgi:hypothetical protein